jgi:DNA polymerase-3 subunit alpha
MFSSVIAVSDVTPKFKYPNLPEVSAKEKLKMEKEVAGMCFSGNLLDSYSKHVEKLGAKKISELLDPDSLTDKESVRIVGIVTSVTVKTTKKNEKMAFFSIEDKYGEIECLAFPAQYERNAQRIAEDHALCIDGNISIREDEEPKILASRIIDLVENADYKEQTAEAVAQKPAESMQEQRRESAAPREVSKLYLRVPSISSREYLKAKNLVDIFEGGTPVIFYDTSSAKYIPYSHGIAYSEYVYGELCDLLGIENVVAK